MLIDTNPSVQSAGEAVGLYAADSGPVRFGARDYAPSVGRRTGKDPILFGGGDSNLYDFLNCQTLGGVTLTTLFRLASPHWL